MVLYLLLISSLILNINSGCCCGGKSISKNKGYSKNIPVNEIKITINKNSIEFNGKNFPLVDKRSLISLVNNKEFSDSYVFEIDDKLYKIIDSRSCVIPNFDPSHFGDISGKQYILACVKNSYGCYIVYCENASTANSVGFFENMILNKINIIKSGKIKDCRFMFYECNAEYIDLSGLDTSEATDITKMFYGCSNLKSIDLSNLNVSKVKDMSHMFNSCENLKSAKLNNIIANSLTNLYGMFCGCTKLESIDLSNTKMPAIKYMNAMFSGCKSLKSVNLNKFEAPNVINISKMFNGCNNLEIINLIGFKISENENNLNLDSIFEGCNILKTVMLDKNENKIIYSTLQEYFTFDYNPSTKNLTITGYNNE